MLQGLPPRISVFSFVIDRCDSTDGDNGSDDYVDLFAN